MLNCLLLPGGQFTLETKHYYYVIIIFYFLGIVFLTQSAWSRENNELNITADFVHNVTAGQSRRGCRSVGFWVQGGGKREV